MIFPRELPKMGVDRGRRRSSKTSISRSSDGFEPESCSSQIRKINVICTPRKVPTVNPKRLSIACQSVDNHGDGRSPKLILYAVAGLFRSRAALQTEVLDLRHQLNVQRRRMPKQVAVSNIDRLVFAGFYHLAPEVLDAVNILKPETIIRWHRAGLRAWWLEIKAARRSTQDT
jgi:hypothetical protein